MILTWDILSLLSLIVFTGIGYIIVFTRMKSARLWYLWYLINKRIHLGWVYPLDPLFYEAVKGEIKKWFWQRKMKQELTSK